MSRTHKKAWIWPGHPDAVHIGRDQWGGILLARRVRWGGECGCKYCTRTKRWEKRKNNKATRRDSRTLARQELQNYHQKDPE